MEQLVLELASEDHNVQVRHPQLPGFTVDGGIQCAPSRTKRAWKKASVVANRLYGICISQRSVAVGDRRCPEHLQPQKRFLFRHFACKGHEQVSRHQVLHPSKFRVRAPCSWLIGHRKVLSKGVSESQAIRIFDVLVLLDLPSEKYLIDGDALVPAPSGRDVLYRKFTHFKGEFTSSWFALLPYMPALRLKKFLANLDKKIIPSIYQPVLLADFLSRSYSAGGFIGVLALDGLFTLMTTYNLDFPSFYEKLYALLDSKILHAPYRRKFFRLFRLFMSSTMIPAYVVAAMIKRIARLSLAAPPSALVWTIPFIYNMLHEHPVCRAMIHREVSDDWTDPFNPKETNLEKCFAFESSLWELLALENHYWPRIAKLSCIFREKFTKPKFNLDLIADEIDQAESRLAANEELSHRWSKRPPTKIAIPDCAFDV